MITLLGGIAEFERSLIKARCDVGRDRSRAKGVRFGRKLKMTRHQIEEALRVCPKTSGWIAEFSEHEAD